MLYLTSWQYIVFTVVFITIYFFIRSIKLRYVFIFTYSFIYCILLQYQLAILLFVTITFFYLAGLIIKQNSSKNTIILLLVLFFSLFLLIVFKYTDFIYTYKNQLIKFNAIASIGLSFYIFTGLSYIFEIYNQRSDPERNFFKFGAYLAYFPKFTSGPIERPKQFFSQIEKISPVSYDNLKFGLLMITIGLFKKLVISDRIAPVTNMIFDKPGDSTGLTIVVGAVLYSFQLYCDFSGYTDIVLGISRIIGIKLTDNFNKPYLSNSVSDFWKRWHITLSYWARDYIFLPVAYFVTRRSNFLKCLNIKIEKIAYFSGALLTMLVIGIWHGPKWTFVIWGLLHGFYLIFSFLTKNTRRKLKGKLSFKKSVLNTFLVNIFVFSLVTFGWIIFRSNSINDLVIILSKLFQFFGFNEFFILNLFGMEHEILIGMFFILVLIFSEIFSNKQSVISYIANSSYYLRWGIYYILILSIIIFGYFENPEFIYFKF